MLTINEAITEAQAEEMAEREVNNNMGDGYKNAPLNNMVTISLDEYLSLYNSTDKYCRLLALIGRIIEPCSYTNAGMRIVYSEEILSFLKYNELEVYADMLKHIEDLKGGEDL